MEITNVMEYEAIAEQKLPKMVYDYYASGAEDQWSLHENRNAFSRILFRPRILIAIFLWVMQSDDSGLASYVAGQIDRSLSWKDVKWLQTITKLPILVKGVLTAEDSKHLDLTLPFMSFLYLNGKHILIKDQRARETVVKAAQGRVPVFLDGGVRRRTDVFKALALGASGIFARAILHLAKREMEERPRTCDSEPFLPSQQTQLNAPALSMKRSLQRFLQKRKTRIQETSPYKQ
ncbi:glycolate oxidase 1-like [Tasmannia lanceolata]|uniref:glycolate oxidase 1-like n=1 Tax=Tasmannia lanceolata TaxID=3420 RepID=UPI0040631C65